MAGHNAGNGEGGPSVMAAARLEFDTSMQRANQALCLKHLKDLGVASKVSKVVCGYDLHKREPVIIVHFKNNGMAWRGNFRVFYETPAALWSLLG